MGMSNSEYWEDRIASATWNTYNSLEDRNRALLELYQDASKSIRDELYALGEKHSKDGVLTRSEIYKNDRLTRLNKKYYKIIEDLGIKLQKHTEKNMLSGFQDVYSNVRSELGEIDYSLPNKKLMGELLDRPWRGDSFSKRLWKNQKRLAATLNDQLLMGLQQGKTVTEIAIAINNVMGTGFNIAHRLVRSETMHYLNAAALQGYKDADVQYVQIIAAQDERTCDVCGSYHGKIYPIDKCPVLPFHANCRCTIIPVMEDYFSKESIIVSEMNGLRVPDKVYQAHGMTKELKHRIEQSVEALKREYDIKLDGTLATSLGKGNERTFFAVAPYHENDRNIGFAFLINTDYNYDKFEDGIIEKYKKGYFAGKSVEDYIAHEMAHVMTFQNSKTEMQYNNIKRTVESYFVPGVSKYADLTRSGTECIAEAFVKLRNGEKVPPEIKPVIKYYIERWRR